MKVLSITSGADLAGISSGIARAFEGHPDITVRSLVGRRNYLAYPQTEPWTEKSVRRAAAEADVIHLHNDFRMARRLPSKPLVIHHHGSLFRRNPGPLLEEQRRRGAIGLVSTLDLWLMAPEQVQWQPSPVDVEALSAIPREPNRTIVIAHAPTRRGVKSTDAMLAAVSRLQRRGYPVEVELIERQPWHRCLARKAKADILFDQVQLGYGQNALEAWAMRIPVIAGAADRTLEEMERRFGSLPFYAATESSIEEAIACLIDRPGLRDEYADRGYQYVRAFHDRIPVSSALADVYRRAA